MKIVFKTNIDKFKNKFPTNFKVIPRVGEFESIEEVKSYVCLLECLVGECFTIYDEDDLVLLEEDFD